MVSVSAVGLWLWGVWGAWIYEELYMSARDRWSRFGYERPTWRFAIIVVIAGFGGGLIVELLSGSVQDLVSGREGEVRRANREGGSGPSVELISAVTVCAGVATLYGLYLNLGRSQPLVQVVDRGAFFMVVIEPRAGRGLLLDVVKVEIDERCFGLGEFRGDGVICRVLEEGGSRRLPPRLLVEHETVLTVHKDQLRQKVEWCRHRRKADARFVIRNSGGRFADFVIGMKGKPKGSATRSS